MYEVLTIGLGVLIGAVIGLLSVRHAPAWAAALGGLAGAAVTVLTGEIELSVGFLVLDVGQAVIAAVLTCMLVSAVTRRTAE